MPTWLLYALTVLIWGSTWIMITFQLGTVPASVSLTYRFAIAAGALALYGAVARRRLRISPRDLPFVAAQGFFMFSLNYLLVYAGAADVTSGLVAVLFTAVVLLNTVNERIFFATPVHPLVALAGLLAITGIGILFWPEIGTLSLTDTTLRGALLVLIGAYSASLGNMAAIVNTRRKLPVIAVNVHGMAVGGAASAAFALATGAPFVIDWRWPYLGSLLFLAIPGTAIAFGLYLELLGRIGATRASYTAVLLPVVALLISTFAEGYRWGATALIGLALALTGTAVALRVRPAAQTARRG